MENTSGQGKQAIVPEEINEWSWGGFFLNWIWGLFNGTYIALLSLIPYAGIIMALVLGYKGNEWAWRNKRWDNIEHFKRVQHKWTIAGLIVFGVSILASIVAVFILLFGLRYH